MQKYNKLYNTIKNITPSALKLLTVGESKEALAFSKLTLLFLNDFDSNYVDIRQLKTEQISELKGLLDSEFINKLNEDELLVAFNLLRNNEINDFLYDSKIDNYKVSIDSDGLNKVRHDGFENRKIFLDRTKELLSGFIKSSNEQKQSLSKSFMSQISSRTKVEKNFNSILFQLLIEFDQDYQKYALCQPGLLNLLESVGITPIRIISHYLKYNDDLKKIKKHIVPNCHINFYESNLANCLEDCLVYLSKQSDDVVSQAKIKEKILPYLLNYIRYYHNNSLDCLQKSIECIKLIIADQSEGFKKARNKFFLDAYKNIFSLNNPITAIYLLNVVNLGIEEIDFKDKSNNKYKLKLINEFVDLFNKSIGIFECCKEPLKDQTIKLIDNLINKTSLSEFFNIELGGEQTVLEKLNLKIKEIKNDDLRCYFESRLEKELINKSFVSQKELLNDQLEVKLLDNKKLVYFSNLLAKFGDKQEQVYEKIINQLEKDLQLKEEINVQSNLSSNKRKNCI